MKRILFFAVTAIFWSGCSKVNGDSQSPSPKQPQFEAKLEIEWKQSDNIKSYTAPKVAYLLPGAESPVIETPTSKKITLTDSESGRVEFSFYSGSTGKDFQKFIDDSADGEKFSYNCYVSLVLDYGDKSSKTGVSMNYPQLNEVPIRQDVITPAWLDQNIFDSFNSYDKYNPNNKKGTIIYSYATGMQRKLVLTWTKDGNGYKLEQSYETGNLFPAN